MEYYFSRNFNGYIYTIDMIRFKTYIQDYNDYINVLTTLNTNCLGSWNSKGFGKFLNNFKIDSLWLGVDTIKNKDSKDGNIFCMEFNPNKATERDFFWFYYFIFHFKWIVTRFDLAIDIPRNINQIVFSNIKKRSCSIFFSDFNNKTYYFGKGDGHTKIYNKKIESSLNHELTRYEVTKECNIDFSSLHDVNFDFNFLELFFTPYELTDLHNDESDTLNAILYAVNQGYPYKNLSRRYKDYIKKEFFGSYDLSNEFANATLNDFLRLLKSRHI